MAYVIEKLSQGRKDLPFVLDRVPHSDHGGTSLDQVSHHPLRVAPMTPRLRPIPTGLRKGQPKQAMADDITVDPMHLLLVEMVQEPLAGVKGQLPKRLCQRTPGIFGVMVHAANEVVDAIVTRVDEGVFAIHDGHKSESKCVINKSS